MPKDAEQAYLVRTGQAGRDHSLRKPFSDEFCGISLASIGFIISLLPRPPARLLDLGCGGGWTSVFFAKYGYDVVGQDISQDMIDLAIENKRVHQLGDNLRFVRSDYESLDMVGQFDCAVFFDSLHHSEDEKLALLSAYKALRPGGMLLTHEPGEGHAQAPGSIEAMQLYGVNERDMPPSLIIERGKTVGFDSFRIYPMPDEIKAVFFGKNPPKLATWSGLKLARRVLRMAFRPSRKASAIVMLQK